MTMTTLPTPPSRSDSPDTFSSRADALLGALPVFVTEANALEANVVAKETAAATSATNASTSATNAATSASTATAQASIATTKATETSNNAAAAAASQTLVAASAAASSTSASSAAASAQSAQTNADRAITAWASATSPAETLAAISKSVHTGAIVKAIIYDTSRDSDSGAWRKRCTHTSWYNETLGFTGKWLGQKATTVAAWATSGAAAGDGFQNTTDGKFYALTGTSTASEIFRGNVREFPAVVAVVAESARVVIYDLTQVGTPMWRVFVQTNNASFTDWWRANRSAKSIAALNGKVLICANNDGVGDGYSGISVIDFLPDTLWHTGAAAVQCSRCSPMTNTANAVTVTTSPTLISTNTNDIAVTIIPDAPTDPATGLPVPTIAVATAGGVSVIKHDGTVVNSSVTTSIQSVSLNNGYLQYCTASNLNHVGLVSTLGASFTSLWILSSANNYSSNTFGNPIGAQKLTGTTNAFSSGFGLGVIRPNFSAGNKSISAAITNAYTSGWQVGDSRGAWLADTVAESITATELVTNGTFVDGTGWTPPAGWSIGSGVLTKSSNTLNPIANVGQVVAGKQYRCTFDITAETTAGAGVSIRIGGTVGVFQTGVGTKTEIITAGSNGSIEIIARGASGDWIGSIDNVSVVQMDADRSVKANGLTIVGTLTKSAVASGAQLVGYSGLNDSNYLEQPYSANMDFGTGDFAYIGWESLQSVTDQVRRFTRGVIGGGSFFSVYSGAGGVHRIVILAGGDISSGVTQTLGWNLIAWVREAGILKLYVNGVLSFSVANSTNLSDAGAVMRLGTDSNASPAWWGPQKMALVRIGATAPSADQIAHIYRTELPLFQAGAQCTIAGTSAAVTALAYDDATDLVHVGTSWGRSAFKDLTRVESEATTTGALTSLSAQYGTVLTGGTSAKVYQPALLLRDEIRRKEEARRALGKVPVFFEFDTASFTASPTSGSPTLTASAIVGTPYVGMGITGSGIPAGTTLIAINGSTYTMSANASSTPGAVTIAQSSYQLQQGYEAKAVYSAGTLKRAGTTKDYLPSDDGFRQTVTFGTSPGSAVWVSVMAVKK